MKFLKILFLYSVTVLSQFLCSRIFFERCNHKGFTCQNATVVGDPQKITYQCSDMYGQDVIIYLWQFIKPSTKTTLMIKNCQILTFYFGCTSDTRNDLIQLLHIQNVKHLRFIPAVLTHNPPVIIFENITNIETIPKGTFSQIKYKTFKPGCFDPTSDLDSLIFQNVKIGTIETEAFENLTNMKYFRWENVAVKTIKANGMQIEGKKDLNMQILNSEIEVLEPLAIQVIGEKLIILGCTFGEIFSNALKGSLQIFEISYNLIKEIQSGGFDILAQDVDFTANHFEHLQSRAFQKISPGHLNTNVKTNFIYNFRQNFIKHVDAGGLHPDFLAYKNSSTEVIFVNNSFHCTCEGLAWLGAEIHLGVGYHQVENFYKTTLAAKNNNTCTFSTCALPLKSIKALIYPNGKCKKANGVEICSSYKYPEETEETSSLAYSKDMNINIILIIVVFILIEI